MIRFDRVGFSYPDSPRLALRDLTLTIPEGELCLVIGPTGSGKSTLLRLVNGLAPHFTGGRLTGTVTVAGRDTRTHPPRDLADVVGVVGQDPVAGFVTDRVDDELAYSMEQLGMPESTMRKRVEEVVDLLALGALRDRSLSTLSAGEQQRVALGSVLTSHPRVLVLDEPTSALDPTAAEEVLAAILRLVHDLGVTVLLAEHRLERVIQYADSIVLMTEDGTAAYGDPATVLATSPIVPPVIELGRLAGWDPLPRSIRDARRLAPPLQALIRERMPERMSRQLSPTPVTTKAAGLATLALRAEGLRVRYGPVEAVAGVDLSLRRGELTALMGRNGSGKSSLLWALQGSDVRSGGTVRLFGGPDTATSTRRAPGPTVEPLDPKPIDPSSLGLEERIRRIALVPQNPADLLYLDSVLAECREADRGAQAQPGTTAALLERLWPGMPPGRHPRDLSEGQRLALVLAIQLVAAPGVLLLDEPTRGLDYAAKRRLGDILAGLAAVGGSGAGCAVLLSSHDVEFVARTADRVVVLADGEIIADGPAQEELTASPSFAPQVARILNPPPLLTVDAVRTILAVEP